MRPWRIPFSKCLPNQRHLQRWGLPSGQDGHMDHRYRQNHTAPLKTMGPKKTQETSNLLRPTVLHLQPTIRAKRHRTRVA